MKHAILSVTVDEKNEVEVRFQGEPQFHIPMLGSLDIAKDWLVYRAKNGNLAKSEGSTTEEQQEREVSRSEAIGVYLEARQKIENRLQAIVNCDESVKFKVNDTLFSKL